jgi:hypothetical protein
VRSESEYRSLFGPPQTVYDLPSCKNLSLKPPVDFAESTIFGVMTQGSGCQGYMEHFVNRDDKGKFIAVVFTLNTIGKCKRLMIVNSWIAVAYIPEDYRIRIELEKKHSDT